MGVYYFFLLFQNSLEDTDSLLAVDSIYNQSQLSLSVAAAQQQQQQQHSSLRDLASKARYPILIPQIEV